MNLGLLYYSACPGLLLGLRSMIYLTANPLVDQNIITTYFTNSAWNTSICPVFPTCIGSLLWCSQISDYHFCLMALLQTCQIYHSNNTSANSSLYQTSMLNLGPSCPLWVSAPISISPSRLLPIDFFKSLSLLFYDLLTLEYIAKTLILQFLTLVVRQWDA